MISSDQPKIFKDRVLVALSDVRDGNMRQSQDHDTAVVDENRRKFLSRNMIAMQSTVLVGVTYDRDEYTQYKKVTRDHKGHGMVSKSDFIIADALATDEKSCALFLPLADCIGAVFYDPARPGRLMLAHLGRHSTEQFGARACVQFMQDSFGSKPQDILVWIGPSPNGSDYPLWKRDNLSFVDATLADLHSAGIRPEHIEVSSVDTSKDLNYFSHSEYLKGNRESDGRYAIVAKLR